MYYILGRKRRNTTAIEQLLIREPTARIFFIDPVVSIRIETKETLVVARA